MNFKKKEDLDDEWLKDVDLTPDDGAELRINQRQNANWGNEEEEKNGVEEQERVRDYIDHAQFEGGQQENLDLEQESSDHEQGSSDVDFDKWEDELKQIGQQQKVVEHVDHDKLHYQMDLFKKFKNKLLELINYRFYDEIHKDEKEAIIAVLEEIFEDLDIRNDLLIVEIQNVINNLFGVLYPTSEDDEMLKLELFNFLIDIKNAFNVNRLR